MENKTMYRSNMYMSVFCQYYNHLHLNVQVKQVITKWQLSKIRCYRGLNGHYVIFLANKTHFKVIDGMQ